MAIFLASTQVYRPFEVFEIIKNEGRCLTVAIARDHQRLPEAFHIVLYSKDLKGQCFCPVPIKNPLEISGKRSEITEVDSLLEDPSRNLLFHSMLINSHLLEVKWPPEARCGSSPSPQHVAELIILRLLEVLAARTPMFDLFSLDFRAFLGRPRVQPRSSCSATCSGAPWRLPSRALAGPACGCAGRPGRACSCSSPTSRTKGYNSA